MQIKDFDDDDDDDEDNTNDSFAPGYIILFYSPRFNPNR